MSRILEKLKKLASRLPEAEQDEFFEFVANLGEQEQPPNKAEETETPVVDPTEEHAAPPPAAEPQQEPPVAEDAVTDEPPIVQAPTEETQATDRAEQPPAPPEPNEEDSPDEGEFYEGAVEDIPQMVKDETDDSAMYDPDADSVEMHGGEGEQEDSIAQEPPQEENSGNEQGDIIAGLQAKVTALEAENAQMKAKFGGNFGYGSAPSMAKGKYQTKDDFIRSLPQIRKR